MAFSRRLGVIGIVGASWLVAVACSDSNDKTKVAGEAGEGGEAPSGGKSNAGGSSNNAGKGGMATAGKGGMSGGTAGSGGMMSGAGSPAAGEAGAAGTPAAVGGAGGAPDVVGGAGGAAGAGGDAGAPASVAQKCSFSCTNDDDCAIGVDDTSHKCNLATHICEDPATACAVDAACLPSMSFWSGPCDDDSGCQADVEACVAADGHGYCAGLPDPVFPDAPCTFGVPTTLPRFGAQGTIEACASADARCIDGACKLGCGDPASGGCGAGDGDTCSPTTGLCECTQGTECTKTDVCGADGHCQECTTNDDCTAAAASTGLDICVNGKCGCSAPAACVNSYASAIPVCE